MPALSPELEALLVEHIADRKKTLRTSGVALAIIGLVLAALSWLLLDPPEQNLWVMAMLMEPLALLLFALGLGAPENAKPLRLLRERAHQVVWVYVRVSTGQGGNTAWVMLNFDDGKTVALPAKTGLGEQVLIALTELLPQASFGFSPERAAAFKADPRSLRAQ